MRTMSSGADLAPLQDVGQRVAGVGAGRRDQRIDVRPVLRPDVAEQVRRDRAVRRHRRRRTSRAASSARRRAAAGRAAAPAPTADRAPSVNSSGGMSYFARHIAPVSAKPELLRALVRQLDEARVVLPHRRRDGVPAFPDLAQLALVARRRHDLRDVVDVQAASGLRRIRAPLALAVDADACARRCWVSSSASFGIGRRGHHQRQLQQIELPALVGGHLDPVEPRRLLGEPGDRVDYSWLARASSASVSSVM